MAYVHLATGAFENPGPGPASIDFPPWGSTANSDCRLSIRTYGAGITVQGVDDGTIQPPWVGNTGTAAPYTLQNGEAFVIEYHQNQVTLRVTLPRNTRIEWVEQFN